jgi:hypothetical protein
VTICSQCEARAAVALKTGGRDSVRGMSTAVFYEPEHASKGSEPQCAVHALELVRGLIAVLS